MNNTIKQLDQIEHYPTSTADTLFALYMWHFSQSTTCKATN
jgi:hypothetical protein